MALGNRQPTWWHGQICTYYEFSNADDWSCELQIWQWWLVSRDWSISRYLTWQPINGVICVRKCNTCRQHTQLTMCRCVLAEAETADPGRRAPEMSFHELVTSLMIFPWSQNWTEICIRNEMTAPHHRSLVLFNEIILETNNSFKYMVSIYLGRRGWGWGLGWNVGWG